MLDLSLSPNLIGGVHARKRGIKAEGRGIHLSVPLMKPDRIFPPAEICSDRAISACTLGDPKYLASGGLCSSLKQRPPRPAFMPDSSETPMSATTHRAGDVIS